MRNFFVPFEKFYIGYDTYLIPPPQKKKVTVKSTIFKFSIIPSILEICSLLVNSNFFVYWIKFFPDNMRKLGIQRSKQGCHHSKVAAVSALCVHCCKSSMHRVGT